MITPISTQAGGLPSLKIKMAFSKAPSRSGDTGPEQQRWLCRLR